MPNRRFAFLILLALGILLLAGLLIFWPTPRCRRSAARRPRLARIATKYRAGDSSSSGGAPGAPASSGTSETGAAPELVVAAPAPAVSELVDCNLLYEGKSPVGWGNIILVVLIVAVALGGGTFVYFNERKLRGLRMKPANKAPKRAETVPYIEGYSPEVVALLPKISRLNPISRIASPSRARASKETTTFP